MVDKEIKNLEKMRYKQQKEIEQTISYETHMELLRQKNL